MKKDGFTLVELLAVVTILSILLLLVVPKIVNQLNNSKDEVNNATKKLIYAATEKYIKDFNIDPKDTYCIPLEDLERDEYISDTITDNNSGIDLKESKAVRLKYKENHGYSYELMTKKECNQEMGMLSEGLIPVAYDGDNWVVVSQTNKNGEWYDYDEQKWANAVVLSQEAKENHKDEIGSIVTVEGENPDALMMLVWIPRYEYKIEGTYGKGGESASLPGEIEVNFIPKEVTTSSSSDYHIHPAFIFGTEQISGMWIGKFETSSTDDTDTSLNLRILPNKSSLRNKNVSQFFSAIRGIETETSFGLSNIDTHMIKNSEWGAVAYLSQSRYGKYGNPDYENKYKEVYQNKSTTYTTGSSNGTPSQSDSRSGGQCAYNDMTELGVDGENYKMGQCGPGASTTGNIYGIYDMSGGSWEYVMGAYGSENSPTISSSGFTTLPNPGYYDVYKTANSTTACNGICYGHALSETVTWYSDYNAFPILSSPWIGRGGSCNSYQDAGIFAFGISSGGNDSNISTRVVSFVNY